MGKRITNLLPEASTRKFRNKQESETKPLNPGPGYPKLGTGVAKAYGVQIPIVTSDDIGGRDVLLGIPVE